MGRKIEIPIEKCSERTKKALVNAKENAVIIYTMNYIFYTECQKAFDIIEEKGLCRHKIKMWFNRTEKDWYRFQTALRTITSEEGFCIIMDVIVQSHGNLEEKIEALNNAILETFNLHNMKNADMLSQILTAICIGDILASVWEGFFMRYKHECGADFSYNFKFANMRNMHYYIRATFEELYTGEDIRVAKDDSFKEAYEALSDELIKKDFMDAAARKAIGFSEHIKEKYNDELEDADKC